MVSIKESPKSWESQAAVEDPHRDLRVDSLMFAAHLRLRTKASRSWILDGDNPDAYETQIFDDRQNPERTSRVSLGSIVPRPDGFGTLMQRSPARIYRCKRICLSGYVRSEIQIGWAGLWLRIDGAENEPLAFDNMRNRPIQGSCPWAKCEVVLDVPDSAKEIFFGLLLSGVGRVWLEDWNIRTVEKGIPTTGSTRGFPRHSRFRKAIRAASFSSNWRAPIRRYSSRG